MHCVSPRRGIHANARNQRVCPRCSVAAVALPSKSLRRMPARLPARRERSRSPFRRHRYAGNLYLQRAQACAGAEVHGPPIVAAKRDIGRVAKAMDDAAEFLAGWIEDIEGAGAAPKKAT